VRSPMWSAATTSKILFHGPSSPRDPSPRRSLHGGGG
jgi:hypothetical protein